MKAWSYEVVAWSLSLVRLRPKESWDVRLQNITCMASAWHLHGVHG